jgi:hypothetical protein
VIAGRRGVRANAGRVLHAFLVGIAAALALYLLPGEGGGVQGLEMRFLCALAIAWLAGEWVARRQGQTEELPALAAAGFAGVNLPPLAFFASLMMVTGGAGIS